MSKRIRGHLRDNVVGYVAIFLFAIGGTAYATHPEGANTISSGDIINNEVKSADIGSSQVNGTDIATSAVTSNDVANNTLTGTDIQESSLGFPGAIQAFAGFVGSAPVGPDYVFRGPTVNVTTTVAQPRVTGAASAPLFNSAISAGTTELATIGLCHDSTPGGGAPPVNFVAEDDSVTATLDTVARIQAATASVSLAPGTYQVGFCVRKLDENEVFGDFVNGWVMRTG